jgi:arylsulfatase A-like enzyme
VFVFVWCLAASWLLVFGRLRRHSVFILAAGIAAIFIRYFRKHEAGVLQFWRRGLAWIVGVAVLSLVVIEGGGRVRERMAVANPPAAQRGSPNVLLIIVDTLRSDHLSGYGYGRVTSPNLDRLAREGVLFESAFAAAPWTLPSHASLLTGRYPHAHEADEMGEVMDRKYPVLPEILGARGYLTAAFSGNTFLFSRSMGFGRGFIHFEDCFESLDGMLSRTIWGREITARLLKHSLLPAGKRPGWRNAADINRNVLHWLDRQPGKPFFIAINYFDLHDPQLLPASHRTRFNTPADQDRSGQTHSPASSERPEAELDAYNSPIAYVDAYDSAVAYIDEQFGDLLEKLRSRGRLENTLIIVTSDHGELLGEHGLFSHRRSLYRAEIQVPLIFWWPSSVPGGTRVGTPISTVHVASTVMALLGEQQQSFFPPESLDALWKPDAGPHWPLPLAELAADPYTVWQRKAPNYYGWLKSVVGSRWHYILHEKFGPELYEWRTDLGEQNNLSQSAAGAVVVSEFSSCLETILAGSDLAKESCGKVSARNCCGDSSSPDGLAASVSAGRR